MKFNFYPASSRIVQFVYFPALSRYEKSEKVFGSLIKELINPDSMERWERIATDLTPIREEFATFRLASFSYYFLIMFRTNLAHITREEEYLQGVQALSEEELRDHLREFLDRNLDMEIPDHSTTDPDLALAEAFRVVSRSTLDSSDRWKLLALLENPVQQRDRYVAFMHSMIPHYRKYYGEVEDAVEAFSEQFKQKLAVNDGDPFIDVLSQYLVSESLEKLKESKTINFWFLGIQDYNLQVIPKNETANIILGISVLEYFTRLKSFEQRNKEDRITVFKNLSDKTRYEVLKLIAEGESSTKVLAEKLGVTSAAISYHLKQLTNDRLVRFDASKPRQRYRINESRMEEAMAGLKEDLKLK